jgi:hypothetical protein
MLMAVLVEAGPGMPGPCGRAKAGSRGSAMGRPFQLEFVLTSNYNRLAK